MSDELSPNVVKTLNDLKPKMALKGVVKRIELYGAFVDLGVENDALLHISQLGKPDVRNVGDVVKEGDEITVYVLKVDMAAGRVAVTLVKPPDFTWNDLREGQVVSGNVVRIESYGVFVDIGAERPAMIHISELSDNFVNSPSDVAQIGDVVQARIIKINRRRRQIDLSMKSQPELAVEPDIPAEDEKVPTAMELALRQAMGGQKSEGRARRENRERERREKLIREQEEIIARTLRSHSQ